MVGKPEVEPPYPRRCGIARTHHQEKLLLPAVEKGGMDAMLVTKVRNGGAFEEMEPKDGGLLLGAGAFPRLLGHG